MTAENRWQRKPTQAQRESLKGEGGPRKNYWVVGKDGKRRGPAALTRDGVRTMEERGAKCVPLAQGEFWTTEIRSQT